MDWFQTALSRSSAASTLASTNHPGPPPGLPQVNGAQPPSTQQTTSAIANVNVLLQLIQNQQLQHQQQQAAAAVAAAQQQAVAQQQQSNGVNGGWRAGDVGAALRDIQGLLPGSVPTPGHGDSQNQTCKACGECRQLRKEFQDLRQQVISWLWLSKNLNGAAEPTTSTPSIPTSLGLPGGDALSALAGLPAQLVQSRKRPASNQQPECPVALRPVPTCFPSNCFPNMQSPFPWSLLTQRPPSPTLAGPPQQQEQQQENGKWSSPSSVESNGHKTDSSTAESNQIDPVGIDASEASSTSSTSTQAMMQSPVQAPSAQPAFSFAPKDLQNNFGLLFANGDGKSPFYALPKTNIPVAATLPMSGQSTCERRQRKQISDDFVKLIQQYELSGKNVQECDIPVPEAVRCDPSFRAVSESQIVNQVTSSKRFDEMDLGECMSNLCKKLAEKRVFGSKLMSQTTVAGPNHSNYNNLPIEGIVYIKDVCRRTFGDKVTSDVEFWEHFRNAMRKLAARCRRVRHAKKTKSIREEAIQLANSQSRLAAETVSQQPSYPFLAAAVAVSTALGNNLLVKQDTDEQKNEAAEALASLNGSVNLSSLGINVSLAGLSSFQNAENQSAALARLFLPDLAAQPAFKQEEIKPWPQKEEGI